MSEWQAIFGLWGSVLMICIAAFGIAAKVSGGKQKQICKEFMDKLAKEQESIKNNSGEHMTVERFDQIMERRDTAWNEKLAKDKEISDLKFKNLDNRFINFENSLDDIKESIKVNHQAYLDTIKEYHDEFNTFRSVRGV